MEEGDRLCVPQTSLLHHSIRADHLSLPYQQCQNPFGKTDGLARSRHPDPTRLSSIAPPRSCKGKTKINNNDINDVVKDTCAFHSHLSKYTDMMT